ncbi:MAG: hypothetical protein IKV94_02750 [Clostridia bacterium]|nr:hypothetical protein [Clostridia bacterium]MBR6517139.1 hypothetical protein [Bacilli bacterium]
MIIQNKQLKKMLKEKGRQYVLTMYINKKFDMTQKQLNYVLEYKGKC